jgi:abhydrolase domain-containing protein 6
MIRILLTIITISLFWIYITYPQIGDFAYNNITDLEAYIYGFKQKQINIDELSMSFYESKNSTNKPTILMIHGFSADKDVWPRFARHLVKDYNIIIPDLAGHGNTGFENQWDFSPNQQAVRLFKLLHKLNISKAHIVGNSMGGLIAFKFANNYPEYTISLMLISPSGISSPKQSEMDKLLANGRNPFEINNHREFYEFYKMTMSKPPWLPGFILSSISKKYQKRKFELKTIFKSFKSERVLKDLYKINIPTLLLWGSEDKLLHVSSAPIWSNGIENIQVEIWDGIGHMPMVETPKRSAKLYNKFLNSIYK